MRAFFANMPGALGAIVVDVAMFGTPAIPLAATADNTGLLAGMGVGLVMVVIAFSIVIYFLPMIIGACRNVTGSGFLFFVNFFLGWTLVGWFGCLIWACFGQTRAQKAFYERHLAC